MKKIASIILFLFVTTMLQAQQPTEILLWPNGAPTSNGMNATVENLETHPIQIPQPSITVYRPEKPNGTAIIMCPGGGYSHLALDHEGHAMAQWMTWMGVTYVVLKYRMPNGHNEVPLSDAEQAIRIVRNHASEWGLDANRIGIMGASAGGHLAASLATLHSSKETRPDFQILFYPVITMNKETTHSGSRTNLIGSQPTQELEQKYSLERQVTKDTPKAFIMLSADDRSVPPVNGISYYQALLEHNVLSALHVYPIGGHGWGYRDSFIYKRQWTGELEKWLREEVF